MAIGQRRMIKIEPESVFVVVPVANKKNRFRLLSYHVVKLYDGKLLPIAICGLKSKYGWDEEEARHMKGVCDIDICANCWGVIRKREEDFGFVSMDELPKEYTLWSDHPVFPGGSKMICCNYEMMKRKDPITGEPFLFCNVCGKRVYKEEEK